MFWLSIPWNPRVVSADIERKLQAIIYIEIASFRVLENISFRYRIELDSCSILSTINRTRNTDHTRYHIILVDLTLIIPGIISCQVAFLVAILGPKKRLPHKQLRTEAQKAVVKCVSSARVARKQCGGESRPCSEQPVHGTATNRVPALLMSYVRTAAAVQPRTAAAVQPARELRVLPDRCCIGVHVHK